MNRKIPIAKKLLTMVLTTSAIMSTLLTTAQILFEYHEKKSELNSVIKGVESSLLPGVARLMWDYDLGNIASPFENLLRSVDVAHVKVTGMDGKVIFEKSKSDFTPRFPMKVIFPIQYMEKSPAEIVGSVEMVFYSDRILGEIQFHFMTLLAFNLIKTIIVALILFQLFAKVVTKPLLEIVNYLAHSREADEGTKPTGLFINRGNTREDEISDLIAFVGAREEQVYELQRQLREKIKIQSRELEETDQALRQERVRSEMNARMAKVAEMANGVAHEINNPLTIMAGHIFSIKKELKNSNHGNATSNDNSNEKIIGNLTKLEQTIARIAKIVAGLRAYARDSSNEPKSSKSLSEIVRDSFNLLESKVSGQNILLEFVNDCDSEPLVYCHSSQLVQTIVSLIGNSFDAVKGTTSPWIKVKMFEHAEMVHLLVIDSGRGIPPDVAQKIFDPFFTTKEVGNGTGLGLSAALGVAKDHGGDLSYSNSSGNTTFELTLPIAKSQDLAS